MPTIIINGGDPLDGCPETYEQAHAWSDLSNKGIPYNGPRWSWDCGFKLDFDGQMKLLGFIPVSVSSRFYPPKEVYGPTWDGSVDLVFGGRFRKSKRFDEATLESLVKRVEKYLGVKRTGVIPTMAGFSAREVNRHGSK